MVLRVALDPERCKLAYKLLSDFLAELGSERGDAFALTHDEWVQRNERYGRNSYATMLVDGSRLYEVFNGYARSNWAAATQKKLDDLLQQHGFYIEGGFSYSLHAYNI
jgi:hypothetical protein